MRYSKVFPRLQMIFQDLPDHHFLLCLSSLQSPNGSRRVPRHRGTLATGFGWQHSEFTHLSGDIPWVTYTLYIYISLSLSLYIYYMDHSPPFFSLHRPASRSWPWTIKIWRSWSRWSPVCCSCRLTTPSGDDWRRGRLFCWKDVFSVA